MTHQNFVLTKERRTHVFKFNWLNIGKIAKNGIFGAKNIPPLLITKTLKIPIILNKFMIFS